MKNFKIFLLFIVLIIGTASNSANYKINVNPHKNNQIVNTHIASSTPLPIPQIPDSWLTFIPRKLPFVPFSGTDYFEMYKTPVDVSLYAGAGRQYNPNYKPYYPEKYLYISDYSYNRFFKETKRTGKIEDNRFEYNHWLWEKIRSDFKRVHGMYNATITDKYGIKHKITWEDGGIVSIYEQQKLFYQYAELYKNRNDEYYKFLQNFRKNYPDVRVNSPYIEFDEPSTYDYFYNGLSVILYDDTHRIKYSAGYTPSLQTQIPNGGVLQKSDYKTSDSYNGFMGPDGKYYYYHSDVVPVHSYICEIGLDSSECINNPAPWVTKIAQKIFNDSIAKAKQEQLNVFLYYEIYDAFCRKYGYKYKKGSYTSTIPMKATAKYDGSNYSKNEYQNFYNRYKDYITGAKSPSYEYLQAKQKLEEKNIKVEISPEKKEIHYYTYLNVNAPQNAEKNEVDKVYMQKKDKVKPQPYSVEKTVSFYKTLNKTDVKMILEHLQNRLNKSKISIDENSRSISVGSNILTDEEINNIYIMYEYQPEKFRQFAKELDKLYSQYYPQNIK